jgi:deoxyadenosine/deoxycytidine kinase/NTP pyrophosphatase (non-canonical NTP hydrolase)
VTPNVYVAIEGPIGVGKTTLARILHDEFGGRLLMEVFEENPFLSDFYADRARYAFQTQIFFLLSRYRQQQEVVSHATRQGSLISDYLFAKDRLFAHLNLAGDELVVYERLHAALAEKIPNPRLVVHLRASTDMLMNRIAFRDRSYERTMSRQYIDDLRVAYERFFADYAQAPVLNVDTNDLDFVASLEDRRHIIGLVRAALDHGSYQQPLPELAATLVGGDTISSRSGERRLGELQRAHQLDRDLEVIPDVYLHYIGLAQEVGELGRELKSLWLTQHRRVVDTTLVQQSAHVAQQEAEREAQGRLRAELADVLSYLFTIANDAHIDLEEAYSDKIGRIRKQNW